jgi:hypothetical protein
MSNKQQTAVEWLCKELESYGDPQFCEIEWKQLDSLIKQAKEMHKDEIMNAFLYGKVNHNKNWSEEYYNETYGGKDEQQ